MDSFTIFFMKNVVGEVPRPSLVFVVRFVSIAMVASLLAAAGCGGQSATVTGRVTCNGKPVVGGILFSPKGDDAGNTGPAVHAELKEDGSYQLKLTTVGKHNVVVTPKDIKYPVPPGEWDYPCDRSPQLWEVKAGDNHIAIELAPRAK